MEAARAQERQQGPEVSQRHAIPKARKSNLYFSPIYPHKMDCVHGPAGLPQSQ
jgi:hypothetical protein